MNRPINLNLFTIHFPIPAIVSILHRVSGAILFLMIPFVLCLLNYSLTESGFENVQQTLSSPFAKIIIWIMLAPFVFHLVAGIRHLLSDIHIGDSLKMGRMMSWLTFVVSAVLMILAGVWIW